MKKLSLLLAICMLPWCTSCEKDNDINTISRTSQPSDSSKVIIQVDYDLVPDTAVVGEFVTIVDTLKDYNPMYELFLGQEFGFIFRKDIIENITARSFSKRFITNGLVRVQKGDDPLIEFVGPDKKFTFKQLEVEKVIVDQVPLLPENMPNLATVSNGEVVVYLAEDTARYTRSYILSDLPTYLLGEKEADITFENRGRNEFIFKRGGIDRFLLLNQDDVRLVIAYEYTGSFGIVYDKIIAVSDKFNPYDLPLNDNNSIVIKDGFLGLDGFDFELKCKWVTN